MRLTLTQKNSETSDVVSFVFTPETPITWKAGQYLNLIVPHENPDDHGTEHYFTVSSSPYEGVITITTRLTGSTFKEALNALPIGGTLEAKDLEGDFTLENPEGPYVFIAGGIGITPIYSILKQLDHEGKAIDALLLYGNRSEDAVFKQELANLSEKNPNFTITYILSPEHINEDVIRREISDLTVPNFYISGPEPMVEGLEKTFQENLGIPDERAKRDYFPGYDQSNF